MSKAEVSEAVGVEVEYRVDELSEEEAKVWLPNIKPYEVEFVFTNDDKLMRLTIVDHKGSLAIGIGRKKALEKVCDSVEEGNFKRGSGSYSYNYDTYECFFIDTKLFNEDIKFYENKTLETWK